MKNILCVILLGGIATLLPAQSRIYVNQMATGANNGQNWSNAFTDLQTALNAAQSGDEVWVAAGTYYPTGGIDRSISFEPPSGVQLYGGFSGNEMALSQRDWVTHTTFLSGDIGISGDSTDNSLTVVYLFQSDSSTVLDGFIVCFGVADDVSGAASSRDREICGGGLFIEAGNWDAFPNIQNCRFWRNTAYSYGGGVMVNGASDAGVAPRFLHCRFDENSSLSFGGGMARFGGSWAERGTDLEGCTFSQNFAAQRGGGLYYSDTQGPNTVRLHGCSFEGNRAVLTGGGAYFQTGKVGKSGLLLEKCNFETNISMIGAAITIFTNGNDFDGEAVIDSCIFFRNEAPQGSISASIIYTDQFGTTQTVVRLSNSRFERNKTENNIIGLNWVYSIGILDEILIFQDTANSLLSCYDLSSIEIKRSRFSSNYTNRLAYTAFVGSNSFLQYSNCLFDNNKQKTNFYSFSMADIDSAFFINCTFVGNEDKQFGSGAMDFVFSNVIMKKEQPQDYLGIGNAKYYFSSSVLDEINCFPLPPNITCGPNNLFNLDPPFRDPTNGDYSLLPCSPLINAGNNLPAANIPTDLAGNPRIQGGTIDIGAYESPAISLAAEPEVKPACVGSSNGSISISPVFGCEPYTYNWLPDAGNGPTLNGLPPGNYLLTITDGSGRQILDTVVVAAAALPELALAASDVQCGGQAGGTLSASVASGTAPFAYQWQPSAADTAQLLQQQPGDYALTVVDANGCQDSASTSIALQGVITLSIDGQIIRCNGETGWLSATPSTGAAPFSWQWTGWPGTDSLAQPLGPGSYSVTVSDAYGCTASNTFPIMTEPDSLSATVGTSKQTDLVMPNGAAVVTTISGGTAPFGFDWNTGSTMQAIAGLVAGTYTVTVTDKNGCEVVVKVVVDLMVATSEAEGVAVLMYPNPAVDWVEVVLAGAMPECLVELSDASGRVLRSAVLAASSTNCTLDLSGLPVGGYLVTVRNGAGAAVFVGKVVKR